MFPLFYNSKYFFTLRKIVIAIYIDILFLATLKIPLFWELIALNVSTPFWFWNYRVNSFPYKGYLGERRLIIWLIRSCTRTGSPPRSNAGVAADIKSSVYTQGCLIIAIKILCRFYRRKSHYLKLFFLPKDNLTLLKFLRTFIFCNINFFKGINLDKIIYIDIAFIK